MLCELRPSSKTQGYGKAQSAAPFSLCTFYQWAWPLLLMSISGQSPERLLAMLTHRQVPGGAAVPPHLGHGHSLGVLQADLLQQAIKGLT